MKQDSIDKIGTLYLLCGKMAAGKSTFAKHISESKSAVLISEDEWLAAFYPDEINGLADYVKCAARLKPVLEKHVRSILLTGSSVVMDFPANTTQQRKWFKALLSETSSSEGRIPHILYYLDTSDEQCLRQLKKRRTEQPERKQFDTEGMFHQVTSYFEAPDAKEGFNTEVVDSIKSTSS